MFIQPLRLAFKCISHLKYDKNLALIMPVLFFPNIGPNWPKFCPTRPQSFFLAGFQRNMLGDSININNFNCNPVILKFFLLKPTLHKKGVSMMGYTQNKQKNFYQK